MKSKVEILHLYSDKKFYNFIYLTFNIGWISNTFYNLLENEDDININDYSIIIVHYLNSTSIDFLNRHIINKPIIWFFWGGDGFNLGKFSNYFLEKKTLRIKIELAFRKNCIHGFEETFKFLFPWIRDLNQNTKNKLNTIQKFNLVVPIIPEDYKILKRKYNLTPTDYHLNYVNPLFKSKEFPKINGTNILLGNSASYTNNHIEAIDWLQKKDLRNRKIIIPLNYGELELAKYVKKYAIKKLGIDNVNVIEGFLPFDEYNKVLSTCNVIIMNHKRQQALGNIVQALLAGAHVYFNKDSTIYEFLKKKDIICSEISNGVILRSLQQGEQKFNETKTIEIFGPNRQHERVKEMVELFA